MFFPNQVFLQCSKFLRLSQLSVPKFSNFLEKFAKYQILSVNSCKVDFPSVIKTLLWPLFISKQTRIVPVRYLNSWICRIRPVLLDTRGLILAQGTENFAGPTRIAKNCIIVKYRLSKVFRLYRWRIHQGGRWRAPQIKCKPQKGQTFPFLHSMFL